MEEYLYLDIVAVLHWVIPGIIKIGSITMYSLYLYCPIDADLDLLYPTA